MSRDLTCRFISGNMPIKRVTLCPTPHALVSSGKRCQLWEERRFADTNVSNLLFCLVNKTCTLSLLIVLRVISFGKQQ